MDPEQIARPDFASIVSLYARYLGRNANAATWALDGATLLCLAPIAGLFLLIGALAFLVGYVAWSPVWLVLWIFSDLRKPAALESEPGMGQIAAK